MPAYNEFSKRAGWSGTGPGQQSERAKGGWPRIEAGDWERSRWTSPGMIVRDEAGRAPKHLCDLGWELAELFPVTRNTKCLTVPLLLGSFREMVPGPRVEGGAMSS